MTTGGPNDDGSEIYLDVTSNLGTILAEVRKIHSEVGLLGTNLNHAFTLNTSTVQGLKEFRRTLQDISSGMSLFGDKLNLRGFETALTNAMTRGFSASVKSMESMVSQAMTKELDKFSRAFQQQMVTRAGVKDPSVEAYVAQARQLASVGVTGFRITGSSLDELGKMKVALTQLANEVSHNTILWERYAKYLGFVDAEIAKVTNSNKALAASLREKNREEVANTRMVVADQRERLKTAAAQNADEVATTKMVTAARRTATNELALQNADEVASARMYRAFRQQNAGEIAAQNRDEIATARMVTAARRTAMNELAVQNADEVASTRMYRAFRRQNLDEIAAQNRDEVASARMITAARRNEAGELSARNRDEVTSAKMHMAFRRERLAEIAAQNRDEVASARMATADKKSLASELAARNADEVKTARMNMADRQAQLRQLAAQNADEVKTAQMVRQQRAEAEREERARQRANPDYSAQVRNQHTQSFLTLDGGAGLFGIQARLMANYGVMNALIGGLSSARTFVVQFEAELKNLQAITGTTNATMEQLSDTFLRVASGFKFSSVEVAKAATTMAQAGLSPQQIQESVKGVVQLATATGTDLKNAVDIATSVMGAFNMTASQMPVVANMVSAALNVSKLDAEKFALGLQYAGNVSAELGISLGEMTTALAAMSNTGIRSGSTLGTGLRQVLEELANPSEKFQAVLYRLGLTLNDVDLRSQGLFKVLNTLRDAGFTTSDAISAFGTRTSAAVASLMNSINNLGDMQTAITMSGNSAKAAETQMDSLAGAFARFSNASARVVDQSSGPIVDAFKQLLTLGTGLATVMSDNSAVIQTGLVVAFSMATAGALRWFAALNVGLVTSFVTGLRNLTLGLRTWSLAAEVAAVRSTGLASVLARSTGLFLGLTVAVGAGVAIWQHFADKQREAKENAEALDTRLNESKGRFEAHAAAASTLQGEIDKLALKYSDLSSSGGELRNTIAELNNGFKDMGLFVDYNTASVGDLIEKLKGLRDQENLRAAEQAGRMESVIQDKIQNTQREISRMGIDSVKAQGLGTYLTETNYNSWATKYGKATPDNSDAFYTTKDALNVMALGNVGGAEATRSRLSEQLAQVDNLRDKALSDKMLERVTKVKEALRASIDLIDSVGGMSAEMEKVRNDKRSAEFKTTTAGKAFSDFSADTATLLGGAKKAYSREVLERDVTVEDQKQMSKAIQSTLKSREEELAKLKGVYAADLENAKASGLLHQAENSVAQLRAEKSRLDKEWATQEQKTLDAQLGSLKAQLQASKALTAAPHNQANRELIARESNTQRELLTQIHGVQQKLAVNKGITTEGTSFVKSSVAQAANITADTELQQGLDQIAEKDAAYQEQTTDWLLARENARIEELHQQVQRLLKVSSDDNSSMDKANAALDELPKVIQAWRDAKDRAIGLEVQKSKGKVDENIKRLEADAKRKAVTQEYQDLVRQIEAERVSVNSYVRAYKDIHKTIQTNEEQSSLDYKRREVAAHAPVAQAERALYAAQGAMNDNFSSPRDQYQAQRYLDTVARPTELSNNMAATQTRILEIEKHRAMYGALIADMEAQGAQDLLLRQGLSTEDAAKKEAYLAALREQDKLEEKVEGLKKKQLDSEAELARLKANKDPESIGEAFTGGFNRYTMQSGLNKPALTLFRDELPQALSTAQNAFGTFAVDVITRTRSISEAFQNMARSILEAMMQIAVKQAAGGLFGGLLSMFGFSSSTTPASGMEGASALHASSSAWGANSPITATPLWSGGFVRRAASGFGPIRTRDSVPILAAPGEFIMRQSAVDLIGADNLSALNAMGNRRASLSTPINDNAANQNLKPTEVNVWVVNKDSVPPGLGPNDVLAIWTQDVLTGGQTKKLLKKINSGDL